MLNENIPKVTLYSDWWAVPNPWRAGYGIILCHKNIKKEFSQGYTLSTNNRMEMLWVISWLSKLKQKSQVDIYTDSQYTINGIEKWWAQKWKSNMWMRTKTEKATNYDLWETLLELTSKHIVTFHWVKWHNGHIENERCDELATHALNSNDMIVDEGFIQKVDIPTLWLSWEKIKSTAEIKTIHQKNTNNIKHHWDICGKCNTPVVKKTPKKKNLKPHQTFYYEYYFHCPGCKTNYMMPEGKRNIS